MAPDVYDDEHALVQRARAGDEDAFGLARFEGRSALATWQYRITFNDAAVL